MVDFIGRQIDVGTKVVYLRQTSTGGEFKLGKIEGFTDRMVKIQKEDGEIVRKSPHNCIVVK